MRDTDPSGFDADEANIGDFFEDGAEVGLASFAEGVELETDRFHPSLGLPFSESVGTP